MDSDTMQIVYETIERTLKNIKDSGALEEEIYGAEKALRALEADLKFLEDESKIFPPKEE